MLSSPAATGSKGERLALGRRPIGCETQPGDCPANGVTTRA
jgi:hypothetical protein